MVSDCAHLCDLSDRFNVSDKLSPLLRRHNDLLLEKGHTVSQEHHLKVHLLLLCLEKGLEQLVVRLARPMGHPSVQDVLLHLLADDGAILSPKKNLQ